MPDISAQIWEARSNGYSDDDIVNYLGSSRADLAPKLKEAQSNGYGSGEVLDYLQRSPAAQARSLAEMNRILRGGAPSPAPAVKQEGPGLRDLGLTAAPTGLRGWGLTVTPKPPADRHQTGQFVPSPGPVAFHPEDVARHEPLLAQKTASELDLNRARQGYGVTPASPTPTPDEAVGEALGAASTPQDLQAWLGYQKRRGALTPTSERPVEPIPVPLDPMTGGPIENIQPNAPGLTGTLGRIAASPQLGLQEAAQGVQEIGRGLTATQNVGGIPIALETGRPQRLPQGDVAQVLGGTHKVIGGTLQAAAPLALPAGFATAPLATTLGLAAGTGAQEATSRGLTALGARPEVAALAGDIAGLTAGGLAAKGPGLISNWMDTQAARATETLDLARTGQLRAARGAATWSKLYQEPARVEIDHITSDPNQPPTRIPARVEFSGVGTSGNRAGEPAFRVVDEASGRQLLPPTGPNEAKQWLAQRNATPLEGSAGGAQPADPNAIRLKFGDREPLQKHGFRVYSGGQGPSAPLLAQGPDGRIWQWDWGYRNWLTPEQVLAEHKVVSPSEAGITSKDLALLSRDPQSVDDPEARAALLQLQSAIRGRLQAQQQQTLQPAWTRSQRTPTRTAGVTEQAQPNLEPVQPDVITPDELVLLHIDPNEISEPQVRDALIDHQIAIANKLQLVQNARGARTDPFAGLEKEVGESPTKGAGAPPTISTDALLREPDGTFTVRNTVTGENLFNGSPEDARAFIAQRTGAHFQQWRSAQEFGLSTEREPEGLLLQKNGTYNVVDRDGKNLFNGSYHEAQAFIDERKAARAQAQVQAQPEPQTTQAEPAAKPQPPNQTETVSEQTPNAPTAGRVTTAESPETIAVQLEQLGAGTRRVVMFPNGTMPPTTQPAGTMRTRDKFGNIYFYKPDLILKSRIHQAAKNNELNEILGSSKFGLGAPDKSQIAPHQAVTVVVRAQNGTEVQSVATTPEHYDRTMQAMQHLLPAGGSISVEDPLNVLAQRQAEAAPPTTVSGSPGEPVAKTQAEPAAQPPQAAPLKQRILDYLNQHSSVEVNGQNVPVSPTSLGIAHELGLSHGEVRSALVNLRAEGKIYLERGFDHEGNSYYAASTHEALLQRLPTLQPQSQSQEKLEAPQPSKQGAPTRTYEEVQADIDRREQELEQQGHNPSRLFFPSDLEGDNIMAESRRGMVQSGEWGVMPADLAALYDERDAIQQHQDQELDRGINERLASVVPDEAQRRALVTEITETDRSPGIRSTKGTDTIYNVGRVANAILKHVAKHVTDEPEDHWEEVDAVLGGTPDKPSIQLRRKTGPAGYEPYTERTYTEAQKILDALMEGNAPQYPRRELQTHKEREPEKLKAPKSLEPEVVEPESAKPLFEMDPDELDRVIEQRTLEEKKLLSTLFGEDGAKKYSRLQRTANGVTPGADAAAEELQRMEASLTPAQRNKLYGIGEPDEHDLELAKSIRSALGRLDWESPAALGNSLRWAISRFDPEKPTANPEAYAQLRYATQTAQQYGWDTAVVTEAALRGASHRFHDPEDAAYILSKFFKGSRPERPAEREPGKLEAPAEIGKEREQPAIDPTAVTVTRPDGVQIFGVPLPYDEHTTTFFVMAAHPDYQDGKIVEYAKKPEVRSALERRGLKPENVVGTADVVPNENEDGNYHSEGTYVREGWRRRGIATDMYRHAEEVTGAKLVPAPVQTEEGKALTDSRDLGKPKSMEPKVERRSGERATSLTAPEPAKQTRADEDAAFEHWYQEKLSPREYAHYSAEEFDELRSEAERLAAEEVRLERITWDQTQPERNRRLASEGLAEADKQLKSVLDKLQDYDKPGKMVRNRIAAETGLELPNWETDEEFDEREKREEEERAEQRRKEEEAEHAAEREPEKIEAPEPMEKEPEQQPVKTEAAPAEREPEKIEAPAEIGTKPAGKTKLSRYAVQMTEKGWAVVAILTDENDKDFLGETVGEFATKKEAEAKKMRLMKKTKDLGEPEAIEETETIEAHGPRGTESERGSRGDSVRDEGAGSLEGVPSEDVRGPGEDGQTLPVGVGGDGEHAGSDAGTPVREGEDAVRPGAGDRVPGVVSPAGRGGSTQPDVRSEPTPTNSLSGDFRLTPEEAAAIETTGAKTRARANIEAIRIIKQIIAEGNRAATLEEQQKIAKFVGWGMSEIAQGMFTGYKSEWAGLREELADLLTEEERDTAETSTQNAHYTRRDMAAVMWDAAKRLGLKPGSSLIEAGMGIGNFFMMMPEDLLDGTSRTGIEMDLLTGAMAKALFPGSNILVKPYQQTNLPDDWFDFGIGNFPFAKHPVVDPAFKRNPALTQNLHNYFFAKTILKLRPGGVLMVITSRFTMDGQNEAFRKWMHERAELLGAIRLPRDTFNENAGTSVTTDLLVLRKRIPGEIPLTNNAWIQSPQFQLEDGEHMTLNEYFQAHPEMMMGQMRPGSMRYRGYPELFGQFNMDKFKDLLNTLPANAITSWHVSEAGTPGAMVEEYPEAGHIKDHQFGIVNGVVVQRQGGLFKPVTLKEGGKKLARMKALISLRGAFRDVIRTQRLEEPEEKILAAREALNKEYDKFVEQHGPVNQMGNAQVFDDDPDWAPMSGALEDYNRDAYLKTVPKDAKTKGKWSVKGNDVVLTHGKEEWVIANKRAIFRVRTIQKPQRIEHVETAAEALAVSLNELGRMDWDRMQELTGRDPKTLQKELIGKIFRNPTSKRWETEDEYLSGNVRQKLRDAQFIAKKKPEFQVNVEALEKVLPPWKPAPVRSSPSGPTIKANLGATWIPDTDYAQFAAEVLKVENALGNPEDPHSRSVIYVPQTGAFVVSESPNFYDHGAANTTEFGTPYYNGMQLFQMALNGKAPVARDTYTDMDGNEYTVKNPDETIKLVEKQNKLKDEFQKWIWSDDSRMERLETKYNEELNNIRLREHDGSHMTFPGLNKSWLRSGEPEPHQKNAVWRTIQTGNTLYAHVVGAGKTLEIIMAAMELRRLGMRKKNMVMVPNHLVEQWRDDWMRAYPGAQILVPTKKDFSKKNRQRLMARIASGNYDGVIVGHKSFEKIPVDIETFRDFIEEETREIREAIEAARAGIKDEKDEFKNPTIKNLRRRLATLEAKLEKRLKAEEKDPGLTFEELGVDQLFVDEADLFKNLGFMTMMDRMAGLPNTDSDRATDLLLKSRFIGKLHGGDKGTVFATGTPVSNSIAEVWTMMRYLMPTYLKAEGFDTFDSWAKTFGQTRTAMEVAPEGGRFIQRTRFAKFQNAAQMMNMFRIVADIRTAKQLNLPTPAIYKGGYVDIVAPASDELKHFVGVEIADRADAVRSGAVKPEDDNMLKISSDGRKASLDLRLIYPDLPDNPESKPNLAVKQILDVYKEFDEHKGTQLVFLDLGTPKSEKVTRKKKAPTSDQVANVDEPEEEPEEEEASPYGEKDEEEEEEEAETGEEERERSSVYEDIKRKLVAGGIPAEEIAFMQDAKTDAQKKKIFDQMNEGRLRVLLGSTEKMGAGTNVQQRLVALHHLDAPWRPRDMQQRDGRIVRQGNWLYRDGLIKSVRLYRYMTEGSFDAFMWETLASKAAPIEQLMEGDPNLDEIDELSPLVLSYEQAKAISSGNPDIREKIILDQDIHKLEVMRGGWMSEQAHIHRELATLPPQIRATKQKISDYESDVETRDANADYVVDGKSYPLGSAGAQALIDLLKTVGTPATVVPVNATYRGFRLEASPDTFHIEARTAKGRGAKTYVREQKPDGKYLYYHATKVQDTVSQPKSQFEDLGLETLKEAEAQNVHADWDKTKGEAKEIPWRSTRDLEVYGHPNLRLVTKSGTYWASVDYRGPSKGLDNTLANHVANFDSAIRWNRDELRRFEKKYTEIESKAGDDFPHEEKLQTMKRRQAELAAKLGETSDDQAALRAEEENQAAASNALRPFLQDPNAALHAEWFPQRRWFATNTSGGKYPVKGYAITPQLGIIKHKPERRGRPPTFSVEHIPSGATIRPRLEADWHAVDYARKIAKAIPWDFTKPPDGIQQKITEFNKTWEPPTETPEQSRERLEAIAEQSKRRLEDIRELQAADQFYVTRAEGEDEEAPEGYREPITTRAEGERVHFRPSFDAVDPEADDPAFLRQAQAKMGEDIDKEQHLYVNTPAMKILRKALQDLEPPGSTVPIFDGVTLSISKNGSLIRHLQNQTRIGNSALWPAFRLLVKQLNEAEKAQTHAITIVRAEPGFPEEKTRHAEREEAFHRFIARISDNRTLPKEVAEAYLNATPFLTRAAERTRELRRYLKNENPDEVVNELLTYLIHGEFDKLQLTTPEATDAWQRFRHLLSKQYGAEAREALDEYARTRNYPHYPSGRPTAGGLGSPRQVSGQDIRGQQEGTEGEGEEEEGPTRYRPAEEQETGSVRSVTLGSGLGGLQAPLVQLYKKDIVPTAKTVTSRLRGSLDDAQKVFAPQTRGEPARKGGGLIREMGSELDQRRDRAVAALLAYRDYFYKNTPKEHGVYGLSVYHAIETGQTSRLSPVERAFADVVRKLFDGRHVELEELGLLNTYIENYLPHEYKKPEEAARWIQNWQSKRPMAGSEAFRKQRTYPTLREALEDPDFTLEPKFDNPVDFVLSKLGQMDKSITAHLAFEELRDEDRLKYVPAFGKVPAGYAPIDDRIFTVAGPRRGAVKFDIREPRRDQFEDDEEYENALNVWQERMQTIEENISPNDVRVFGRREMGRYYAAQPLAQVINNHLSPGISHSNIMKAWRAVNNTLNMIDLSASYYHGLTTTLNSSFSDMALGMKQTLYGKPVQGAKSIARGFTPFASAVHDVFLGTKIQRVWDGKETNADPMTMAIVDALKQGGGKARQDLYYATNFTKAMIRSWNEPNNPIGAVWGAVWRAPFAALEQTMKPIMEYMVPRAKLGAFAKLAQLELEKHPDLSLDEARQRFGKIWDSIDDRFGQLSQRNLLMNATVRDVMNALVGRPGWNIGTVRALAGGAADLVRNMAELAGGGKPEISDRSLYLIALLLGGAVLNGLVTFILTRTAPHGQDFLFPRDGGTTEDGRPSRIVLPTYVAKDLYSYFTRPLATIKAKAAPALTIAGDLLTNRNFQQQKIFGRGGIGPGRYAAGTVTPYSVQGLQKNIERAASPWKTVLPFVGIMPAGKRVGLSKAEQIITEYQDEQRANTRPAPTAHTRARTQVFLAARSGNTAKVQQLARQAIAQGTLAPQDVKQAIQRARQTPLVDDFQRLPLNVAMEVYDAATPQERQQIQRLARHKAAAARGKPWEWDDDTRKLAAKYFGIRPPGHPSGDLAAPSALQ